MFYKLIQRKRDEWLADNDCPIKGMLQYITARGKMRDAQIEAIKTYLFLKIACQNKPLWRLFSEGSFLTADLDNMKMTVRAREIVTANKAAATLYEYACLADEQGGSIAPALKDAIESHPDDIDFLQVFRDIFYGVEYPDYIFSLPMGAGKTFLMAAFVYLDLHLSKTEPDNPAFAHNFMILAPSGLKSSILPSIKTIQDFDPSWILPEPAASQLKKDIQFEMLDEQATAKKSNQVKNPNAQKISAHQPFNNLRGLVMVTNAEKVILDKVDKDEGAYLFTDKERKEILISNELRSTVSRIPHLAIFIDEVHHASDGDIKLRQVVNSWTKAKTFNCVLGFSGTPYLASAENVQITPQLYVQNKNLANVVYYYPLIDGIGNFLKSPQIKFSTGDWQDIVRRGVTEFMEQYKDTTYSNGTCAKQAIYCGKIENLEENIYPLVSEILSQYVANPSEAILKYHDGNKNYPAPADAANAFSLLDTDLSKIKLILLVQIGKEGWDCKSLTSVILPQKGVCPRNMVLQTSCRCLRQVAPHEKETALIWLNGDNGNILNQELKRQQHTSIDEINRGGNSPLVTLQRFSRMQRLNVPPIDFCQLKVTWPAEVAEEKPDTASLLRSDYLLTPADSDLIRNMNVRGEITNEDFVSAVNGDDALPVTFHSWLQTITKESCGTLRVAGLKPFADILHEIFCKISVERDGNRWLSESYNHTAIRANIRKAFISKRTIKVKEEVIPEHASILKIDKFTPTVDTLTPERYYPGQKEVRQIMADDKGGRRLKKDLAAAVKTLKALPGMEETIKKITSDDNNYEEVGGGINKQTYHYLPYRFDSEFEIKYFSESLLTIIRNRKLEVYFNGDDTLTNFQISCYKHKGDKDWQYLGKYIPDFLMISRDNENKIKQVLIIETKGEGFAAKFKDRKEFMSTDFIERNNKLAGYQKFSYLYIEDTLKPDERDRRTLQAINTFFK